jgi:uncharacterized hydantoinase/oxoprolinase family protein
VCADGEMLSDEELTKVAVYLCERQVRQVAEGLFQVLSRLDGAYGLPVVVAGAGSFLAAEAARRLGLVIVESDDVVGGVRSAALPASAAALLMARALEENDS